MEIKHIAKPLMVKTQAKSLRYAQAAGWVAFSSAHSRA